MKTLLTILIALTIGANAGNLAQCQTAIDAGDYSVGSALKAFNSGDMVKARTKLSVSFHRYVKGFRSCANTALDPVLLSKMAALAKVRNNKALRNAAAFQKVLRATK